MTAYGSAALGQLFFFHVVLIRKVIFMVALQISSCDCVENYGITINPWEKVSGYSTSGRPSIDTPTSNTSRKKQTLELLQKTWGFFFFLIITKHFGLSSVQMSLQVLVKT